MSIPPIAPSEEVIAADNSPKKTGFGLDVIKLVSGTTIAQVVGILAIPILSRLYDPNAFGILSVFTSIITIITVISCLRYEFAIMLPESTEEAGNLVVGSVLISLVMALLTVPVIWFGGAAIAKILKMPEIGPYLWLIPPVVFLGGFSVGHPALNFWSTRTKHFGWLSFARVLGAISTTTYQLVAGFIGFATGSNLILANVLGGGVISTLVIGLQVWKNDGSFILKSFNWQRMLQSLKRHYKFPLFDTWAVLINTISVQIPTFFLATYFSASAAGYYALGNGLLRLPLSIVGNSIAQVFYQRASEAKANGSLARVVEITFGYLVRIGMFPLLVLTVIGKDLFVIVLGGRWAEAGVYTQILSVFTFFVFISSPLSTIFRLLEKQEFSLLINIIVLATRILSLVIGVLLHNVRIALLLYAVTGIMVFGYLSITTMRYSGVALLRITKIIMKNLLLFLPIGIFLFILSKLGLNSWFLVGGSVLILIIYYLFMIRTDARIKEFIINLLPFLRTIQAFNKN